MVLALFIVEIGEDKTDKLVESEERERVVGEVKGVEVYLSRVAGVLVHPEAVAEELGQGEAGSGKFLPHGHLGVIHDDK